MSQPIRGQVDHFVFPIDPKNTNFVEDVDILLPVKYCWILFSSFRREVENISANQRPGRPSCFSDRPKNTILVEDVEILLPTKCCWIRPVVSEKSKMSQPIRGQSGHLVFFFGSAQKHKLCRGRWDLASYQVSLNSVLAVSEEKSKMSQPIRG